MKKCPFGVKLILFFAILGIVYKIATIVDTNEKKCLWLGCDNSRMAGSEYCSVHQSSDEASSYDSSTYSSTEPSSESDDTFESYRDTYSNSDASDVPSSSYNSNDIDRSDDYYSYDDGYDDVYMDGDYDDDRYNKDSDYADGVDDAEEDLYQEYGY